MTMLERTTVSIHEPLFNLHEIHGGNQLTDFGDEDGPVYLTRIDDGALADVREAYAPDRQYRDAIRQAAIHGLLSYHSNLTGQTYQRPAILPDFFDEVNWDNKKDAITQIGQAIADQADVLLADKYTGRRDIERYLTTLADFILLRSDSVHLVNGEPRLISQEDPIVRPYPNNVQPKDDTAAIERVRRWFDHGLATRPCQDCGTPNALRRHNPDKQQRGDSYVFEMECAHCGTIGHELVVRATIVVHLAQLLLHLAQMPASELRQLFLERPYPMDRLSAELNEAKVLLKEQDHPDFWLICGTVLAMMEDPDFRLTNAPAAKEIWAYAISVLFEDPGLRWALEHYWKVTTWKA